MTNRVVRVVVPSEPVKTPDIWAAARGVRRDLPAGETIERECAHDVLPTLIKWLKNGTLKAADKATADLAGVELKEPTKAKKAEG